MTRSPLASHLPIPGVDRQRALISYRPIFGTDGPERRTRYCFGGWAAAVRSDLLIRPTPLARERPERAERFVQAMPHPPLAWFLPGPEHMRGGAARRFASGKQFHRGSQAESTWRNSAKEIS